MGTSSHNIGQKGSTPLVPSWLEQQDFDNQQDIKSDEAHPIQIGESNRFTLPRGYFTRYIHSPERDTSVARKSISNYVRKSMLGSRNVTQRLGAARRSTLSLLNITGVFATGGSYAVEQYLSLENLSRKSARDALVAITDFVCPDGGPQDEGIARTAYVEAIEESPELVSVPFEELTAEHMFLIVQKCMTNVIWYRIINDIGNKIIMLPKDVDEVNAIDLQMREFIGGAISDSFARSKIDVNKLPHNQALDIVNKVYRTAFEILARLGDDE